MNKKQTIKKTIAMLMGVALAVGATGCNFILTDSEADLKQTVATVDITGRMKNSEDYSDYADKVAAVTKYISKDITKRELVASYLSTGYQYVESYGYTYEATFNLLLDSLVKKEILIQYAIAYYLRNNPKLSAEGCEAYINAQLAGVEGKEKELLENNKAVLAVKYFLTENGENEVEYDKVVYSLKSMLNNSLDSIESGLIKAESESHNHGETRTLPNNVGTTVEDYYTTDYEVYTGRNAAGACGEYEKVDGSTVATRQKAYNSFLSNLQSYSLIDLKEEDPSDITKLNYYYVELGSSLSQNLINKYFESLESEISEKLTEAYMNEKYDAMYALDADKYANDPSAFATAMDSVSDESLLLYGLENFGYVYNILIPFSTSQTVQYTEAKNTGVSEAEVFKARREILKNVTAKDLRGSWISEHDHANYSNVLDDDYTEGDAVYFFQDQLANDAKYEKLTQYAGTYPFNGTVTKDEDGEFVIKENTVSIVEFIALFEEQIEKAAGVDAIGAEVEDYSTEEFYKYNKDGKKEVDYSKFTYYMGSVALTDTSAANFFNPESDQYKALSAVNELMFAYSTDPGCLNTYMGYAVSPYSTNFVKEFEYAAQEVVKAGVGNYAVCATDYGWHILYCSFKYTAADVYGGYVDADKEIKGTFSNMFYEMIKETAYANYATEKQNAVLLEYNQDSCVTKFEKAYKDLLSMDK